MMPVLMAGTILMVFTGVKVSWLLSAGHNVGGGAEVGGQA